MGLHSLANRARRWLHGMALEVWHDPSYRLPLPGLEFATGFEPRRADFVAWYLLQSHALSESALRKPRRASYEELARVHTRGNMRDCEQFHARVGGNLGGSGVFPERCR